MSATAIAFVISVVLAIIVAGMSYGFGRLGKRRDRSVQHEDAQSSAGQDERKALAKGLEDAEKTRADELAIETKTKASQLADEHAALVDVVHEMRRDIVELQTKITPFWGVVQAKIIKDLTHPSPQFHEMDSLMRELNDMTITAEGRDRLDHLLDLRIVSNDPEVSTAEKESAKLMKGVMKKVLEELL